MYEFKTEPVSSLRYKDFSSYIADGYKLVQSKSMLDSLSPIFLCLVCIVKLLSLTVTFFAFFRPV